MGIRQTVSEIRPMLLLRASLLPPLVHPVRILPPLVRLEVRRVRRVDMNEPEHLTDGTDEPRVQDRTGRRLRGAPRVGC